MVISTQGSSITYRHLFLAYSSVKSDRKFYEVDVHLTQPRCSREGLRFSIKQTALPYHWIREVCNDRMCRGNGRREEVGIWIFLKKSNKKEKIRTFSPCIGKV